MRYSFKLGYAIAIMAGSVVVTSETSNAMPIATPQGRTTAPLGQNIDWACGPGWHVNPWGRCVPNYWRGGWYGGGWRRAYYGYPGYGGGAWYGPGWYGQPSWHHGWHEHEHEHEEHED